MSDQDVTIDDDSPDHPIGDRHVPSIDDFAEQVDQPGKRGLQKKWACKGVGRNYSRVCGKMRMLGHCLSFYKTPEKGTVTAFHTANDVAKCSGKWTPAQKDSMYSQGQEEQHGRRQGQQWWQGQQRWQGQQWRQGQQQGERWVQV